MSKVVIQSKKKEILTGKFTPNGELKITIQGDFGYTESICLTKEQQEILVSFVQKGKVQFD